VRLFVAVNLPDAEKHQLGKVLDNLRQSPLPVRWVEPDSLHITLKFLGTVSETQRPALTDALDRAVDGIAPFDVGLAGFGTFPARGRPNIFWIGASARARLAELQERVEEETVPLGFAREARLFQPHLTIGRLKKDAVAPDAGLVDRILDSLVYKSVVKVDSVDLMRSHMDSRGARYERIERHGLSA
jgi:RNA 2',3'-cyclic 3'-phosphodiesterase